MSVTYKFYLSFVGLLIAMAALISGCTRENANASGPAPEPPGVTVSQPLQKTLTHFTEYTGTTEALEVVNIRARVEGTLTGIHFTPGNAVEKGDLLYTIDPEDYKARLDEARATLGIREAALELAEATLLRREKAFKDKAVSEVAVIQARTELSSARAGRAAARAALKQAAIDLSHTRITAPISGKTSLNLVDAGNLVGAGEYTLLTTIVRDDHVYAYFTVNERDLLGFRQGPAAQPSPAARNTRVFLGLANQDDYPFEGSIDYIDPLVDTASGTIRIRGIFPNPDQQLLPGLYARIKIPTGTPKQELLVPDTAVGRDQKGYYLLVAEPDAQDSYDKVRYQPVEPGPLVGGMRVIRQGLTLGDRVIVNGIQKARPGSPVNATETQISMTGAETAGPSV